LQDQVVPQADVPVAPSTLPTLRRPVRSTRGMAPQRMTYEVKGEPTAYFLAECFQTMNEGLVSFVNQREHPQKNGHNHYVITQKLSKQVTKVIQIPQILWWQ